MAVAAVRGLQPRTDVWTKELGLEEQLGEYLREAYTQAGLDDPELLEEITKKPGIQPDPELLSNLYRPPIPHTELPEREEDWNVYRISIDGVTVRYVEDSHSIQATVEGHLSSESIETLQNDLLEKLQRLEKTQWMLETI